MTLPEAEQIIGDRLLRTKSGKVLTDADIEAFVNEAERGYDITKLRNREKR